MHSSSVIYPNFVDLVPKDEVMEYSDYVFGLILKLTKVQYYSYITCTQSMYEHG